MNRDKKTRKSCKSASEKNQIYNLLCISPVQQCKRPEAHTFSTFRPSSAQLAWLGSTRPAWLAAQAFLINSSALAAHRSASAARAELGSACSARLARLLGSLHGSAAQFPGNGPWPLARRRAPAHQATTWAWAGKAATRLGFGPSTTGRS